MKTKIVDHCDGKKRRYVLNAVHAGNKLEVNYGNAIAPANACPKKPEKQQQYFDSSANGLDIDKERNLAGKQQSSQTIRTEIEQTVQDLAEPRLLYEGSTGVI